MVRYLAAILLAGCVEGHDATPGTYRVESHVGARCDGIDQPVLNPIPYLKAYKIDAGITISMCIAPSECVLTHNLPDRDSDAYVGDEGSAQTYESGRFCGLSYTRLQARFDDGELAFEMTHYGETIGFGPCTIEEAIRRGTTMSCGSRELIEANHE